MATGFSRSPKLLKGALVEFSERFLGPVPNVIPFQFNPETLSRSLEIAAASDQDEGTVREHATAQPDDPRESFTLDLYLDAADALEEPDDHPVAVAAGVGDRISALEMLLYPQEGSLLGGLLGELTTSLSAGLGGLGLGGGAQVGAATRSTVPIVLFVWGPGRVVPVRLTAFSVEEQAFSPTLYPIRAKVSLSLKVLRPDEVDTFPDGLAKKLAKTAYKVTKKQKETLAASNLAHSVESVLGLLPF